MKTSAVKQLSKPVVSPSVKSSCFLSSDNNTTPKISALGRGEQRYSQCIEPQIPVYNEDFPNSERELAPNFYPPQAWNYTSTARSRSSHENLIGAHLLKNRDLMMVSCTSMFTTPKRPELSVSPINQVTQQQVILGKQIQGHQKNIMSFGDQKSGTKENPVIQSQTKSKISSSKSRSPVKQATINPRLATSPPDKSQQSFQTVSRTVDR